jgi:hypothetical protein
LDHNADLLNQGTEIILKSDKFPLKCCIDQMTSWSIINEGQKIKCMYCNNWFESVRVAKNMTQDRYEWPQTSAVLFYKHTYATLDEAKIRWGETPEGYDPPGPLRPEKHLWGETHTTYACALKPDTWFFPGTWKARWDRFGIIVIEGTPLDKYEGMEPSDAELREMLDALEGV